MLAICAIQPEVLRRLRTRGAATVEVISCRNVLAARASEAGTEIFVTEDRYEDLGKGSIGIVAVVESVDVGESRIAAGKGADETEVTRARLRLAFSAMGTVRRVYAEEGTPVSVDVHRAEHLIIG